MAQINLLDSDKKASFKVTNYSWLSKMAIAVLVLVILSYGYLYFRQYSLQKQINDVRNKTTQSQKQAIGNTSREQLLTRQGQIATLNPLLKGHVYWSGLLPELARVSLAQSSYTSIDATVAGSLILSVTMPTYADLDKFLQVFDLPDYNRQFSNVRVISINKNTTTTGQSYIMRVQLTFNPDFIKNPNP